MKAFRIMKLPIILVGLGAAVLFSPPSKAQEVSPDHFTENGVQNVYEPAPAAAPKVTPAAVAAKSKSPQTKSLVALEPIAKRTPVVSLRPGTLALADKRKTVQSAPPKP